MGTELHAIKAKKLSTSSKRRQELDHHRDLIGLEVEASLNNGGWWRNPSSKVVKAKMFLKWMDALEQFTIGEISRAFDAHVIENPNKKPNEGHIVALIRREINGGSVQKIDMAAHWSESIKNQNAFVSNSCFTPSLVREMLDRSLVTEEQLKARGIQF